MENMQSLGEAEKSENQVENEMGCLPNSAEFVSVCV